MRIIYLDGQYIKVNAQIIEAFTPGVFKAKGVFETMLGLDGMVIDIALHMKRLRQGLKALGMKPPLINQSIFKKLMHLNQLQCARVRLMAWQVGKKVHVMVTAMAYKVSGKETYRVCLIKTDHAANGRWANVKSLDYGMYAEAFSRAQSKGFDEALLINREGYIFEASRANIFWSKGSVLYTPPLSSGCLNGITRQQVIQQAGKLKIPVKEKNLTLKILKEADAAFVTNSLRGIVPIALT